jgi:hypothetical protein
MQAIKYLLILLVFMFLLNLSYAAVPTPPPTPSPPPSSVATPPTTLTVLRNDTNQSSVNDSQLISEILGWNQPANNEQPAANEQNVAPQDNFQQPPPSDELDSISTQALELKNSIKNQVNEIKSLKSEVDQLNDKVETYLAEASPKNNYSSQLFIGVLIMIVFLIVTSFILYFKASNVHKKNIGNSSNPSHYKEEYPANYPQQQSSSGFQQGINLNRVNLIKNYIVSNVKNGYSPEIIHKSLIRQGYNKREIYLAFQKYYTMGKIEIAVGKL